MEYTPQKLFLVSSTPHQKLLKYPPFIFIYTDAQTKASLLYLLCGIFPPQNHLDNLNQSVIFWISWSATQICMTWHWLKVLQSFSSISLVPLQMAQTFSVLYYLTYSHPICCPLLSLWLFKLYCFLGFTPAFNRSVLDYIFSSLTLFYCCVPNWISFYH